MLAKANFNGFEAWLQSGEDRLGMLQNRKPLFANVPPVEHQKTVSKAKNDVPCKLSCYVECENDMEFTIQMRQNEIRTWKRGGLAVKMEIDGRKLPTKEIPKGNTSIKMKEWFTEVVDGERVQSRFKIGRLDLTDDEADATLTGHQLDQVGTVTMKIYRVSTIGNPGRRGALSSSKAVPYRPNHLSHAGAVAKLGRAHEDSKKAALGMCVRGGSSRPFEVKTGTGSPTTRSTRYHDREIPWLMMVFRYRTKAYLKAAGIIDEIESSPEAEEGTSSEERIVCGMSETENEQNLKSRILKSEAKGAAAGEEDEDYEIIERKPAIFIDLTGVDD